MTTREAAVERYTFRCHHCGREWSHDYDVVRVTLPDGHAREYYSRNGFPVAAPGAPSSVSCPACGAEHADARFATYPAPQGSTPGTRPPRESALAEADAAQSAREMAQAIEALLAAAKQPGDLGFSRVDDVKEVARALQHAVTCLPQLLHQLGTVLNEVESRPNPQHAGNIPDAIRSLQRAAETANELTEPLAHELSHVRTALTTLESLPIRSSYHQSQDSAN